MLVLSRHCGDSIMIGNDIVIKIIDVRGERVQVGVDAPLNVPVLRSELKLNAKRIVAANMDGTGDGSPDGTEAGR